MTAALTRSNAKPHSRQKTLNRVCILLIGSALFLVSALRHNVGNDYYWYTNIMHEAYHRGHVPTEAGFNVLVRALYTLFGFDNYLFVFALFSLATVALFLYALAKYSEHFALSFAMFILLGYYFQSLSTVRYYAVLPLSLFALRCSEKRDWPRFLLLVVCGALFHKSMLCVLLFYPLACIPWKKWMVFPAVSVCALVAALPAFWTDVAVKLYPTYENVAFERGTLNVFNVARCALVLAFVVFAGRTELCPFRAENADAGNAKHTADAQTAHMRVWVKLSIMGLVFYVCGWFLPQISRIAYYLTLPQLLLVPSVLCRMEDEKKKKLATYAVLACCVLYFARYMLHAGDEGILILPYRSFLFS